MDLKHSSARLISHSNDSQWWLESWSMNGGWWWTFWLFLDTWGPTHAYLGTLPKSVKKSFLLLQQRGVRRFSHAWSASYMVCKPQHPMMSSDIFRGRRMNGRHPSIRRKVRPKSPWMSSWIWNSDTWWHLHLMLVGGVIVGQLELPTSKTIISLSMYVLDN